MEFTQDRLKIQMIKNGNHATLKWIGQSMERDPGAGLDPYLKELLPRLKGLKLTLSFERLDYMNSSTIPSIIGFMKKLDESGIETRISYDASSKWQAASFKALKTLSMMMDHVTVQEYQGRLMD